MFEIESRTNSVVQDHRVKTQSRTKTQSNETQTKAMIIWSSRGLKTTRSGFQLCRPQSIHWLSNAHCTQKCQELSRYGCIWLSGFM